MSKIAGRPAFEARAVAIRATRSYMRRMGIEPSMRNGREALAALQDLNHIDPELVAAIFSVEASNDQLDLFIKDWDRWCKAVLRENQSAWNIRWSH